MCGTSFEQINDLAPATRPGTGRQRRDPPAAANGGVAMSGLLDRLLAIQGPLLYLLVGLTVFVEDALFVGFVVPGETAAVLGGVAAGLGHASLAVMMVIVVAAAIVGDSVGY